ncbi:P-loop containing nucleoside triphosphate hydrolase protein [Neocallimastix lanati (nom. inval.)]|nr:P-loop containing nucleoside triphosphate hydrolase protein [Neocallimastix sp. JGI-2020a]
MYNKNIPIYKYKDQLIDAIQQYQILVIVGETGSGKTTQLPQYILNELNYHGDSDKAENDDGKKRKSSRMSIAVTQPRRIAAIAAAQQVCREYHGSKNYHLLGKEIGYKIRFENVTTPNVTKLTYMTDGVLLREIIDDPLLTNYNIIIIDEAHERSIETDILLGLMKKACKQRSDLKLLVMSATLNMVKFSDFFDECPIFSIPGRLYDIDIFYQKNLNFSTSKSKYVSLAVDTALNIHQNQSLGHILVFLTGQSEIERACKEIKELEKELDYSTFPYNIKLFNQIGSRDSEIMEKLRDRVFDHENENVKNNYYHNHSNNLSSSLSYSQEDDSMYIKGLYIFPIYSVLETRHQKSIFKEVPPGYRKVIFATNIAQTSLTIPGIKYVIDSGFVKQFIYKPELSMDILDITPISKTAAIQRAGRAGRTQNGKVYRLYSKLAYEELEQDTLPEIKRCNLLGSVLLLKKLKLKNILDFDFIDKPNIFLEVKAIQELYLLNALDKNGRITETGNQMANFPISPYLAKVLLSSITFKCSVEMIIIVSMLSVEDVYITPRGQKKQQEAHKAHSHFYHVSGDHMTMLNIYKQWASPTLGNFSKEWCRKYFLHYRALVTARNIKGQLELIFQKLNLPLLSCHHDNNMDDDDDDDNNNDNDNDNDSSKHHHHRHDRDHHHHHRHHHHHHHNHHQKKENENENENEKVDTSKEQEQDYYDISMKYYDYTLILKAVSQAYYMNVAKRFTGRPYFYNYKQSTSDTLINLFKNHHHHHHEDDNDNNTTNSPSHSNQNNNENRNDNPSNRKQYQELVPLFIHPSSSLHALSHSLDAHYLEWVIYHHTIFTNRCYLRHVSIVRFEWVKELLDSMDNVDYSRLFEKDINTIVSEEEEEEEEAQAQAQAQYLDEQNDNKFKNKKIKRQDEKNGNNNKKKNEEDDDDDEKEEKKEKKEEKDKDKHQNSNSNSNTNSNTHTHTNSNSNSSSISMIEDSRKAALQRYLQRKQLKEKKRKRK